MTDKVRFRILFAVVLLVSQLLCYSLILLQWKKDCKTIGKNCLAVPLKNRTINYILICLISWVGYFLNIHIWE